MPADAPPTSAEPPPSTRSEYPEAFDLIDKIPGDPRGEPEPAPPPAPAPAATPEPPKPAASTPPAPAATPPPTASGDDLFNVDQFRPKTKPAEPAAPAAPPVEADFSKAPKQLREAYEQTKRERDEIKAKIAELQNRRVDEEALKPLKEEIERYKQQATELDTELRYLNFERSAEFKERYQKPYEEAWKQTVDDLHDRGYTDPETGNEVKIDAKDVARMVTMNPVDAAIAAKRKYGPLADVVLAYRNRMADAYKAREAAKAEWKEKGAQREAEMQREAEAREKRFAELVNGSVRQSMESYPELFAPAEGDEEGNKQLQIGDKLARLVFNGEGLDPNAPVETKMETLARARANLILRAASWGRDRIRLNKLAEENESLKAELAKLRGTEPGHKPAAPVPPGGETPKRPEDGIDAIPGVF